MIPAPLSLLAQTVWLGDSKALEELMSLLIQSDRQHQDFNLAQFSPAALEARYPRRFRENESRLAAIRVKEKGDGLAWLDAVFEYYFLFDGDFVVAREDKRLDYARLCAQLHPALPVAWKLAGLIQEPGSERLNLVDLRRIISVVPASFLPIPYGTKSWADLHVHVGGSPESSINLFQLALSHWQAPRSPETTLPSQDHERVDNLSQRVATYQTLFHQLLDRLYYEKAPLLTRMSRLGAEKNCLLRGAMADQKYRRFSLSLGWRYTLIQTMGRRA
jgi:hypothetical protein